MVQPLLYARTASILVETGFLGTAFRSCPSITSQFVAWITWLAKACGGPENALDKLRVSCRSLIWRPPCRRNRLQTSMAAVRMPLTEAVP